MVYGNFMNSTEVHVANTRTAAGANLADGTASAEPQSEAEALKAYRAATRLVPELWDRAKIGRLEALAARNGWDAIEKHRKDREARRAAAEHAQRSNTIEDATGRRTMPKSIDEFAQELHDEFDMIVKAHHTQVTRWDDQLATKRVTLEYVQDQTAPTVAPHREHLNTIAEDAEQYVETARAEYSRKVAALTAAKGDTQEQLLAEMRAGKIWDRIQRELANVKDTSALVNEVIGRVRNADADTLGVLVAEMPSYLTSRGMSDADMLVQSAVHDAHPQLQEAGNHVDAARKLHDVVKYDIGRVSKELDQITGTARDTATLIGYVNPAAVV